MEKGKQAKGLVFQINILRMNDENILSLNPQ